MSLYSGISLIGALVCISACMSVPMATPDDGEPTHNSPLLHQTAEIGIPGFEGLRWGMTEMEVKQFHPDSANAFEARLNSFGECSFQVTPQYFHTMKSRVLNALEYIDVRFVNGNFKQCREQTIARLLQQNGSHPMREAPSPLALYRNQLTWDGPLTWVQFYDDGFGQQQTFHIVYQDSTASPLLRRGGDQVLNPGSLIRHH